MSCCAMANSEPCQVPRGQGRAHDWRCVGVRTGRAAKLDAVESGRPNRDADGDGPGRVVRRPARLRPGRDREHQRRGLRRGVRSGEPGSDPRRDHDPGRDCLLQTDLLRAVRGYGTITVNQQYGWRTYHSLQVLINRRFQERVSFGFNDTWSLYDHQSTAPRFDHLADGEAVLRADQAEADRLLGTTVARPT